MKKLLLTGIFLGISTVAFAKVHTQTKIYYNYQWGNQNYGEIGNAKNDQHQIGIEFNIFK